MVGQFAVESFSLLDSVSAASMESRFEHSDTARAGLSPVRASFHGGACSSASVTVVFSGLHLCHDRLRPLHDHGKTWVLQGVSMEIKVSQRLKLTYALRQFCDLVVLHSDLAE